MRRVLFVCAAWALATAAEAQTVRNESSDLLDRMAYPVSKADASVTLAPLSPGAVIPFASTETGWRLDLMGMRTVKRSTAGLEVPFTPRFKLSLEASRSEGYDGLTQHYSFGKVTWIKSRKAIVRLTLAW